MPKDDNILNTPGLMDPGTEFGNIMQSAMKIKGAQMEQDRRKFETYPMYLQNTMWTQHEECLALRNVPVGERLPGATTIKEKGNERFRKQAYQGAIECYEAALGSFRFLKQLDPEWKSKGIKDDTIDLVDESGDTDDAEVRQTISDFLLSCYNNLAACYIGRASTGQPELGSTIEADYKLCVQASSAALEIDPKNTKALYRRARALSEPMTASDEDTDMAIKDLREASVVAPDDKQVRVLLTRLRKVRSSAKKQEADAYSGLFGKAEIYDPKSLAAQAEREKSEKRIHELSTDKVHNA